MLDAVQLAAREGKLTASRVKCLMEGDEAAVYRLWQEMVGDPAFEPDDLSDVWPVQLGMETEALNLRWYSHKRGVALTRLGEVVTHPLHDWAACTLDGFDATLPGPVECKHVGGFEKRETVVARYMPQVHWQMLVTGTFKAALSIIEGAREPVVEVIDLDADYATELWHRAKAFMESVWALTPPVTPPAVEAPVKASIVVEMTGSNAWSSYAADWLDTRDAAKRFRDAEKELKALVPAEATKAHGAGIQITRNKAGSLSIKESKA